MSEEMKIDEAKLSGLNPESLEEIKYSLTRIEKTLYESQQVLYGKSEDEEVNEDYQTPRDDKVVHKDDGLRASQIRSYESTMSRPFASTSPDRSSGFRDSSMMNGQRRSSKRGTLTKKEIKEITELSASARVRKMKELKKRGEQIPDLEEGVDEYDTAQNVTLDETKARIKRELEEYRIKGPLMMRRKSVANRKGTRRPVQDQTPQRKRTQATPGVSPAPRKPGASRKQSFTSPAADNVARTTYPVKSTQQQKSKSAPPPPVHASKPPRAAAAQSQEPPQEERKGGRVPVWERLYNQASVQRENQARRREQKRHQETAPYSKGRGRRVTDKPSRTSTAPPQHQTLAPTLPKPSQEHKEPHKYNSRLGGSRTLGSRKESTADGEAPNKVVATRTLHASHAQKIASKPATHASHKAALTSPPQKMERKVSPPPQAIPTADTTPQTTIPEKEVVVETKPERESEPKFATQEDLTVRARGYSLDSNTLGEDMVDEEEEEEEVAVAPAVPSFVKPLDFSRIKK